MYCANCGTEIMENAKFCSSCGMAVVLKPKEAQQSPVQAAYTQVFQPPMPPQTQPPIQPPMPPQTQPSTAYLPNQGVNMNQQYRAQPEYIYPVGFSARINDPAFARYQSASNNWSFMFSLILAAIAAIALPIYGKTSGKIPWPDSLYYGLGLGGMFIVIALVQILKRGRDSTWDGTVIDKKYYNRVRHDNNSSVGIHYTEYLVKVRRENGKVYKHRNDDQPGIYNYYNVGEKVRHHKGLYFYEKYDKSMDTQIMCVACMTMNNIQDDFCFRCKCPLLK